LASSAARGKTPGGAEPPAGTTLAVSTAGTISIREVSGAGTVVAQIVLTAAGPWTVRCPEGLHCSGGNFFVQNSAGNISGGVRGF